MILQYIQGTKTYDIHYAADSELELVGYIDSDWAGVVRDYAPNKCRSGITNILKHLQTIDF